MAAGNASGKEPKLVVRLFLVRHGQTLSNIEGMVAGQAESPLTELGEKQALALGKSGRIQFSDFWRLYASDLERAQKTAQLIQLGAGIESSVGPTKDPPLNGFRLDSRLRELSKGARQGFPKSISEKEALVALKRKVEQQGHTFTEDDVPMLESEQDGFARFTQWLYEVVRDARLEYIGSQQEGARSKPDHVLTLVVSHSALLRAILTTLFSREELLSHGATFDTPSHLLIPNTSLTVIDIIPNLDSGMWDSESCPLTSSENRDKLWRSELVELMWTGHYDTIQS